ncbi:MAG TPA: methyl-accepting chemotaxis protein [Chromatiaceae bacterium]|nr:methyl-accepting chemotaxis protein [Chromatiaceae bacterium]
MNTLLAPVAVLFSRLGYRAKFSLIFSLVLLPMAYFAYAISQPDTRQIAALDSEAAGLKYERALRVLLELVPQHRGMTNAYLKGSSGFKPRILQRRTRIGEAFTALRSVDKETHAHFDVSSALAEVERGWRDLAGSAFALTPEVAFSRHTRLIAAIVKLMTSVADKSGLASDTDLESRYIVSSLIESIPGLVEPVGQSRGYGAGVASRGSRDVQDVAYLAARIGVLQHAIAPLEHVNHIVRQLDASRGAEFTALIETLNSRVEAYVSTLRKHFIDRREVSLDPDAFFAQGTKVIDAAFELFDAGAGVLRDLFTQRLARAEAHRLTTLAIVAGALLLVGWLFAGFYAATRRQVDELTRVTAEAAKCNLGVRAMIDTQDEMGEIGTAINAMLDSFQSIVMNLQSTVHGLQTASSELMSVASASSGTLSSQQEDLVRVASASSEFSATVAEVADRSSTAADAVKQARDSAAEGQGVATEATRLIQSLASEIEQGAAAVRRLESESEQIGAVLDVIRGIAEQTNLLALNAAIEAARAGEQGRGFAVVADEVRTLAGRTQESTQQIQHTIERLQAGASDSAKAMQLSQETAVRSVEQSDRAGAAFGAIAESVCAVSGMIEHIAQASDEQRKAAGEITTSITRIEGLAEQTVQSAANVTAASNDLQTLAGELNTLTEKWQS